MASFISKVTLPLICFRIRIAASRRRSERTDHPAVNLFLILNIKIMSKLNLFRFFLENKLPRFTTSSSNKSYYYKRLNIILSQSDLCSIILGWVNAKFGRVEFA